MSSVSSAKQIQHLRGSGPDASAEVVWSVGLGERVPGEWVLGEEEEVGVPMRRV